MEAQTLNPVKADFASGISLAQELDRMSKEGMIALADSKFGLTVDPGLDPQAIKEHLLRVQTARRNNASETNKDSLAITVAIDKARKAFVDGWDKRKKDIPFVYQANPSVQVKFFFMQHVGADLEFLNSFPYGVNGEVNKWGFKKQPKYHLFHGEMYVLPLLLVEHLRKQTYVTHKPVIDPNTGMQNAVIPIIKPRFVFEQMISAEESILLAKHREDRLKGVSNEANKIPNE